MRRPTPGVPNSEADPGPDVTMHTQLCEPSRPPLPQPVGATVLIKEQLVISDEPNEAKQTGLDVCSPGLAAVLH